MGANLWQEGYPALELAQQSRGDTVGGQRITVVTPQVPSGFYLWIAYLDAIDTDNNGQAVDLYMVEPTAYPGGGLFPLGFPSGTGPPAPAGFVKLAPHDGALGSTSEQSFTTGNNRPCTPFHYRRFFVPSLWALAAVEANNVVSGLARSLIIRYLFAAIENGCSPPFF